LTLIGVSVLCCGAVRDGVARPGLYACGGGLFLGGGCPSGHRLSRVAWPLGRSWRLAPSAIGAVGRGPMLCDPWVSAGGVRAKLAFVGSTRTQKQTEPLSLCSPVVEQKKTCHDMRKCSCSTHRFVGTRLIIKITCIWRASSTQTAFLFVLSTNIYYITIYRYIQGPKLYTACRDIHT